MAEYRAADLPEGSVVLHQGIKIRRCGPLCLGSGLWCGQDGLSWSHVEIDWLLDEGAEVLRVGTREEGWR